MPGIASAATAVVIAHVAAGTTTIRVGSGGIMLPNHAPLMVAEAFGTLAALHPRPHRPRPRPRPRHRHGDGAGAPPPRSPATPTASRRTSSSSSATSSRPDEGARVRAIPGEGADVEVWILGSSLFGAQLAAHARAALRLRLALRAGPMEEAIEVYRTTFRPSEQLAAPYVMLGSTSSPPTPTPRRGGSSPRCSRPSSTSAPAGPASCRRRSTISATASTTASSSPSTRRSPARSSARPRPSGAASPPSPPGTGADELMLTGQIYDHAARLRSFEIAAESMAGPPDRLRGRRPAKSPYAPPAPSASPSPSHYRQCPAPNRATSPASRWPSTSSSSAPDPAGLAAAIRLKQRDPAISVAVLEKGSEVGAHILSGAVIDPIGINKLLPNWREEGAPIIASRDRGSLPLARARRDRFVSPPS